MGESAAGHDPWKEEGIPQKFFRKRNVIGGRCLIMSKKKLLGFAIGLVVAVVLALLTPPEGLTAAAMLGLGILLFGIILLVFDVFPNYATIIGVLSAWAILKVVPFKTAFGTFAGTTWWLMFGAVGMGIAGMKSGLLKRIACHVMKIFPATLRGQITALMCSGLVISPLIPSTAAKAAIMAPISLTISDSMGYQRKSNPAVGLFGAFFIGAAASGPAFLSASYLGYTVLGLLPAESAAEVTWFNWLFFALPWVVMYVVGNFIGLNFLHKIKDETKLSSTVIENKITELGPMSKNEKITLCVLIVSLLMWMTEQFHGINATLTALVALFVLLAFGVYGREEFGMNMGWDNLIFIGGTVSIGPVLTELGLDKYIANTFGQFIIPVMGNMWLFIPLVAMVIFLARFVIASNTTALTLFIIILLPFAQAAGIHPWVIGFIVYCSIMSWVAEYENAIYLNAKAAVNGMFDHYQVVPQAFLYLIVSLVGLLVCIPWWKMLGLIP